MYLRRVFLGLIGLLILFFCAAFILQLVLKPTPQSQTEIFRGVYLTVEEIPEGPQGSGHVMTVEVHWDTPGVRLEHRPFDHVVDPENSDAAHFNLEFADLALRRTRAAVLINTCLFHPDNLITSLPGSPVRAVETIVVDGQISHIHEHSYLLYWDGSMNARMLQAKPPDETLLSEVRLGLGLQGIQVVDGSAAYQALDNKDEIIARTFIGIDPERRILYLMAFENASGFTMIERAIDAGVVFGGQFDSGSSTNLLIGPNANGVMSHTGIRNLRPLGPYLTVHAEPL